MGAEFPPPQSVVQGEPTVNYAEVEKIFALADNIYDKIVKAQRIKNLDFRIFKMGVFLGTLSPPMIFVCSYLGMPATVLVFFAISSVVGWMAISFRFFAPFHESRLGLILRAESRALQRTIDLLHELEQDLDRQTAWSPVQRAEFRIRLSRYVMEVK